MGKLTIQEIAAILIKKNGIDKRAANQFASAMFRNRVDVRQCNLKSVSRDLNAGLPLAILVGAHDLRKSFC